MSTFHVLLPVRLVARKNNFIALPLSLIKSLKAKGLYEENSGGVKAVRIGWYAPVVKDDHESMDKNKSVQKPKGEQSYFSWSGAISKEHDVEIPMDLAEIVGIKYAMDYIEETTPNKKLFVSVSLPYAPIAKRVDIEPLTPDDWEILKLDAGFVEANLLSQICVVSLNTVFPVWVHEQNKIMLKVTHIHSGGNGIDVPVRLARDTEVVVAPKLRNSKETKKGRFSQVVPKVLLLRVQDLTPPQPDPDIDDPQWVLGNTANNNCVAYMNRSTLMKLREMCNWPKTTERNGAIFLVDSPDVELIAWISTIRTYKLMSQKGSMSNDLDMKSEETDFAHAQQAVALRCSDFVAPGHIALSHTIRYAMYEHMKTQPVLISAKLVHAKEINNTFHPAFTEQEGVNLSRKNNQELEKNLVKVIRKFLSTLQDQRIPISDKTLLLCDTINFKKAFKHAEKLLLLIKIAAGDKNFSAQDQDDIIEEPPYWIVDSSFDITKIKIDAASEEVRFGLVQQSSKRESNLQGENVANQMDTTEVVYAAPALADLGAFQGLVEKMMNQLNPLLNRKFAYIRQKVGTPIPGGIYLCGNRGSGKSHLIRSIARRYRCNPDCFVHTVWVTCSSLKGGKRSFVRSTFESAWREALSMAPSLIVLDDLDTLLPASVGGGGSSEDAQTIWLSEWIEDLLSQYREKFHEFENCNKHNKNDQDDRNSTKYSIGFIASGKSKSSIRASLLQSGMFDEIVEIDPPNVHERAQILESIINSQGGIKTKVDFEEVAALAEGYAASDLKTLTDRALHHFLTRMIDTSESSDNSLLQSDYEEALQGYTPLSLRGANLAKSEVKWSDVGGLHDIKQTLKETLELPLLFAPLYERCPVKLASGILLYGPPGCGKTLLAGAVATECGLNFISVKGPEVLDKYIGASEKAVRDLFSRGAAAAPCVLFFDEFEAVAPRRGNDSTGVTDRVVNQLLTFLDGVESRTGVYVMAASSRPDLIDPALLRPGRLDKQLLCDFPTLEERKDILNTIAMKLPMTDEAKNELENIASAAKAESFTGADLQALLYSAQLEVVHSRIPKSEEPGAGDGSIDLDSPKIDKPSLYRALEQARPSVSIQERERYNRIYRAFKGQRVANFAAIDGYGNGRIGERSALK